MPSVLLCAGFEVGLFYDELASLLEVRSAAACYSRTINAITMQPTTSDSDTGLVDEVAEITRVNTPNNVAEHFAHPHPPRYPRETTPTMRIRLILGSARTSSNTGGVLKFVEPLIESHYPEVELEVIHLIESPNHPLPLVLDNAIPAGHDRSSLPDCYPDPNVRAWSATVLQWDAVIVLTPAYNWSIPGILNNAFDHLCKEWVAKPAGIITLGGHGGGKCAAHLKTVLDGALDMKVVDKLVEIQIPKVVIRMEKRLHGNEEVLAKYRGDVLEMMDQFVKPLENPQVA
jgi:NAD(P)H-dependent FMN reductase